MKNLSGGTSPTMRGGKNIRLTLIMANLPRTTQRGSGILPLPEKKERSRSQNQERQTPKVKLFGNQGLDTSLPNPNPESRAIKLSACSFGKGVRHRYSVHKCVTFYIRLPHSRHDFKKENVRSLAPGTLRYPEPSTKFLCYSTRLCRIERGLVGHLYCGTVIFIAVVDVRAVLCVVQDR